MNWRPVDEHAPQVRALRIQHQGHRCQRVPPHPDGDGEQPLNLPPPVLRKIIDQVVFAAADAKDTSCPALTGVLARFEGDRLTLAATDGYRLSLRRTKAAGGLRPADISVIIPARPCRRSVVISGEADPEQPVELAVAAARNQILFRLQGKGESEKGAFYQVALRPCSSSTPSSPISTPSSCWRPTRTILDTAALQRGRSSRWPRCLPATHRIAVFSITPGATETEGQLTIRATAEAGDNVSSWMRWWKARQWNSSMYAT